MINILFGYIQLEKDLKKSTGDEFWLKNPLVMPPNFKELPEPGNMDPIAQSEQNSFGVKNLDNDNSSNIDSVELGNNSTKNYIKNVKMNLTRISNLKSLNQTNKQILKLFSN